MNGNIDIPNTPSAPNLTEAESQPQAKEVQNLADQIKERPPEILHENMERNIKGVEDQFLQGLTDDKDPRETIELMAQKPLERLQEKTARFQAYYASEVFSKVKHAVPKDIGDEVTLKSAKLLVEEGALEKAPHAGDVDEMIGNTDYVFANSEALPSRSMGGGRHYLIQSKEGYVVPIDHADMVLPNELYGGPGTYPKDTLALYAKNLYTIPDFERFFSTYTAALFENPEEYLDFVKAYGGPHAWSASFWDEQSLQYATEHNTGRANTRESDLNVFTKMRGMLVRDSIYPPFSPEYQFRDQVEAVGDPVKQKPEAMKLIDNGWNDV